MLAIFQSFPKVPTMWQSNGYEIWTRKELATQLTNRQKTIKPRTSLKQTEIIHLCVQYFTIENVSKDIFQQNLYSRWCSTLHRACRQRGRVHTVETSPRRCYSRTLAKTYTLDSCSCFAIQIPVVLWICVMVQDSNYNVARKIFQISSNDTWRMAKSLVANYDLFASEFDLAKSELFVSDIW